MGKVYTESVRPHLLFVRQKKSSAMTAGFRFPVSNIPTLSPFAVTWGYG